MGCLIVGVNNRNTKPQCSADAINSIGVEAACQNSPVKAGTDCQNAVNFVSVEGMNKKVSVGVALVCKVSIDKYELFYVTDGAFIVTNGYFMVQRNG
jgi:hypothetical protein